MDYSQVQVWLALIGPAAVVVVAVGGGLYRLLSGISHRIVDIDDKLDHRVATLDDKLDKQTAELKDNVSDLYNEHEKRDAERHVENVQRLTRLETLVNNGKWSSTFPKS